MKNNIINSVRTSIIDFNEVSDRNYQINLITNEKIKFLSVLEKELRSCNSFMISVAFITLGGLSLIKGLLLELEEKNIKGKIVTGDYLYFTDPQAIKELNKFSNLEIKINNDQDLHTKGYMFEHLDEDNEVFWNIIIGSSNLTQKALTSNKEWNMKISTKANGKIYDDIVKSFHNLFWEAKSIEEILPSYESIYKEKNFKEHTELVTTDIKPNLFQVEALKNLKKLRSKGEQKALIISATGTGKTFLAAFDVLSYAPKKLLFVVHRELIAKKSMESFKKIIPSKNYGLYTGNKKELDADYVFATRQTLAKDKYLLSFAKKHFDYIIIDEAHHISSSEYTKITSYFTPDFLLGLTATPERSDDNDILDYFNNNIAYEIRLYDALENNFLTPFRYFGISDENSSEDITTLEWENRVNFILGKSKFYSFSGEFLSCVIFVRSVREAKLMEDSLLKRNLKAKSIIGTTKHQEREYIINEFEKGNINYIITVDIFNEGIDIPCINQVIFLRPTESTIIYIQQLGRGLRKFNNKEYLTVLDFIGNYNSDFLVPMALSGDLSFDKHKLHDFVQSPNDSLPGCNSIFFEEKAEKILLNNISNNLKYTKSDIKNHYFTLKRRLNRSPLLYDFYEQKLISPTKIINNYENIINLQNKYEENNLILEDIQVENLNFLGKFFTPTKRIHEFFILESLKEGNKTFDDLTNEFKIAYGLEQKDQIENALKHLMVQTYLNSYKTNKPIIGFDVKSKKYSLKAQKSIYLDDLIKYNKKYFFDNYSVNKILSPFKLYSKRDIVKSFLLDTYEGGINVQGYLTKDNICICYVTLSNDSESNTHDDKIISSNKFLWYSQNSKKLFKDNKLTREGKIANNDYDIHLFVRKNKKDEYFYFDKVKEVLHAKEVNIDNKDKVEYTFLLNNHIPKEIYHYLLD